MNKIHGFTAWFLILGLISNDLYSNNEYGISDSKLIDITERVQSSSVTELLLIKQFRTRTKRFKQESWRNSKPF